jgi:hypothetical protein
MPDYSQHVGTDNLEHLYRPVGSSWAPYVSLAPVVPLGHFQLTVSSAALPLPSIPTEARRVVIRSLGAGVNFRDDGTNPTAGTGFPILADEWIIYDTVPTANFKLIRSGAVDADVRISYYG